MVGYGVLGDGNTDACIQRADLGTYLQLYPLRKQERQTGTLAFRIFLSIGDAQARWRIVCF